MGLPVLRTKSGGFLRKGSMMTSLSIDVVIPVLNHSKFTESLLHDISNNSVIPNQVIIIDNGSSDNTPLVVDQYRNSLPLNYIRNEKNLGVNASWNLGTELAEADLISYLNNDLIINSQFFAGVQKCFSLNLNCGMACPQTTMGDKSQQEAARSSI